MVLVIPYYVCEPAESRMDTTGSDERRRVLRRDGAARGIRTPDPIITNDVLYQLSYCGEISGLSNGRHSALQAKG